MTEKVQLLGLLLAATTGFLIYFALRVRRLKFEDQERLHAGLEKGWKALGVVVWITVALILALVLAFLLSWHAGQST